MKQYRCKVDNPWGRKGKILNRPIFIPGVGQEYKERIYEFNYPDIFEELQGKSDEDLLSDLFCKEFFSLNGSPGNLTKRVAQSLLSENAINPEWLKKLRGE